MQTLVVNHSFQAHERLLSRLGLALILMSSLLLGIWAVKDTIALRNILLVGGSLLAVVYLFQYFRFENMKSIGIYWLPVICIVSALLWVVLHYCFFSIEPEVQLKELQSIWFRSALASLLGLATGIALIQRPRWIVLFWAAILISFFVLFAQYLPLAIQSGNMVVPLDPQDFRRYLFIGKINPMYLGVLLIAGSTGLLLDAISADDKSWVKKTSIFWLLCLSTAMYSFAFIVNTRSGILLGSLPIIGWCVYGVIILLSKEGGLSILKAAGVKKFIFVLIIALSVVGVFGYKQIQRDSGWHQLIEDIEIGYQVEKYPHWQNVSAYGFPLTASGKVVTYNTYERVAWATAGIKSVVNHPYGIGILILPLGVAAKDLFPGVGPLSTHSGWIDLSLAFGLPFICLMLMANLSIVYLAVKKISPFRYTIITLAVILFALFLLGELSNGHNLEMLFYFFVMMSGLLISQAIKKSNIELAAGELAIKHAAKENSE